MEKLKKLHAILVHWGFRIAFFIFVGIVFTAFFTILQFWDYSVWVNHTYEVIRQINQIETHIERAESSQRTYLLSRHPLTLKAYQLALGQLDSALAKLNDLTKDNSPQTMRTSELEEMIHARIKKMDQVLQQSEKISVSESVKLIDLHSTGVIRIHAQKMEDAEVTLLKGRREHADSMATLSIFLIMLGAAFTFCMLILNRLALKKSSDMQGNQALLLNSIFENMSSGLMVVDDKGHVTMFNKAAEELIGTANIGSTPEERIKANGLCDIKTGEPLKKEESVLTRSLAGESVNNFEVASKRDGHDPRILSVFGRPIRNVDNKITGAIALFQDVTRQKNLEKEWQKAREAALEASRLKSDFLAAMSHEIRTPMNGVLGMATLLLDTSLSKDQTEYVKTIKSSADSLLSLINQILDHSKIEAGKLELDIADFNLFELCESVISMFRYQATSKSIALEIALSPELPQFVKGDATRVRQILINMISNAFKFTEKGFVRLSVSLIVCSDDMHKVMFQVKDTGIGISKTKQAKLFGKYSQVHSGNTAKYGGSGLGLMISRELTRLMRGEIGVESAEGFGSRFWFTAEFDMAERAVHSPLNQSRARERFKGHVLVVEDQPVNQAVIEKYLEMYGLTCEIAKNGEEAIKIYNHSHVDLILMDCQMPVMDGYAATKKIRELEIEYGKKTPIVALTAEGRSGDRQRCFEVGMDDFLVKPLEIDMLALVLKKFLSRSSGEESFDKNALAKMAKYESNGRPLIEVMIEEYLRSSPRILSDLRVACNTRDFEAVAAHAHALRGISLTVGLIKVGELCERMEKAADTDCLSDLEIAWNEGCQWLKSLSGNKPGQAA